MTGPSNLNRSSKAFASPGMRRDAFNKANQANRRREQRFQFGGNKSASLQPWLTIVLLFLLMPFVIIPFIIKPLQPYFIELTLPVTANLHKAYIFLIILRAFLILKFCLCLKRILNQNLL